MTPSTPIDKEDKFNDDIADILINLDFQITVTPDGQTTSKHVIKAKEDIKQLFNSHLRSILDEVIGYEQYPDKGSDVTYDIFIRSGLRAEQRKIAAKYLSGKETK